jgi:hypothetical protein
MGDLIDFLMRHPNGGYGIVVAYKVLEESLATLNRMHSDMRDLKGSDWILPHISDGFVTTVELVDGDEPWIGSIGNAVDNVVSKARFNIETLTHQGWGNLPLVKDIYEKLMREPFPKNYEGYRIPSEYVTIDVIARDSPNQLLLG